MAGEQDMFAGLQAIARELSKVSAEARQSGQEQLELAQLLGGKGGKQNYFVEPFNQERTRSAGGSARWLPSMQSVDCKPVPRAIRSLYSQVECEMFMGLFPEINRAWITIDNKLFLWNYYKGEDFYMYDGLDQLIVSVGLARARPGAFDDGVEYVLALSTPVEIVLLKLRILGDDSVYGDVRLEPTEFNMASDNVPMRSIAGTAHGRIFMGGHDGRLYEFLYHESPGSLGQALGFQQPCRIVEITNSLIPRFVRNLAASPVPIVQVVVDHDRQLLYTLSDRSALALYRISAGAGPGPGATPVKSIENVGGAVSKFITAQRTSRGGVQLQHLKKGMRIVSLQVVRRRESDSIHLVALTNRGVRIYLSTQKNGDGRDLVVKHVRGPPNKEELARKRRGDTSDPFSGGMGGSTSMLAGQRHAATSGSAPVDEGIEPGPETEAVVTDGFYAGGVTLLSFAPAYPGGSSAGGAAAPESSLWSLTTDLSMRKEHKDLRPAMLPAYPPHRWLLEGLHEVVDTEVLDQGPTLRQTIVEGGMGRAGAGVRAAQGLPVGRIWGIREVSWDPTRSPDEEAVFVHMLRAPNPEPLEKRLHADKENSSVLAGNKRSASDMALSKPGRLAVTQSPETVALTELATQHVVPRRCFHVLTSHGLWMLTKPQPVNQLHMLMKGPDPGTNEDIIEFFHQYGLDESCAMALAIACKLGGSPDNASAATLSGAPSHGTEVTGPFSERAVTGEAQQSLYVAQRAAKWFVRIGYGTADSDGQGPAEKLPCYTDLTGASANGVNTANGVGSIGGAPAALINPAARSGGFLHSGCYLGICLHMSRLLRPVWHWGVIVGSEEAFKRPAGEPVVQCRFNSEQLRMILGPLKNLRTFLQTHSPFKEAIHEFEQLRATAAQQPLQSAFTGPHFASQGAPSTPAVSSWFATPNRVGLPGRPTALSTEKTMVAQLYSLLDRAIQALVLFDILQTSHSVKFASLVTAAEPEMLRTLLDNMTWEEMVCTSEGKVVACALVKLLVVRSPSHEARDLVERLKNHCSAFFSEGDALQISAFEELAVAEQESQPHKRNAHLVTALERLRQGLKKVTGGTAAAAANTQVTRSTMRDACEKFESMGQPDSAIQLVLYCAECFATQPLDMLPVRTASGAASSALTSSTEGSSNGGGNGGGGATLALSSMQQNTEGAETPASGRAAAFGSGREAAGRAMREFCFELALQVLARNGPQTEGRAALAQGGADVKNKAMAEALKSKDRQWHYTLYMWLLEHGLRDAVLDINSPFIAQFLENPEYNDPSLAGPGVYQEPLHADMHLVLLVEWFARQKDNLRAALVMQRLAKLNVQYREGQTGCEGPTLKQRVHYFTKALNYAKAAQGGESHGLSIAQLKDERDVAQLQLMVREALRESTEALARGASPAEAGPQRAKEQAMRQKAQDELAQTLKTPSDLYNDYAYRFGLWKACLTIMQECDNSDTEELHILYRNLLREAVWPMLDSAPSLEQLTGPLRETVHSLGQEFYPNGSLVFPYEYLIHGLEDLGTFYPGGSRESEWNGWVLATMIDVGVSFEQLFDAYCAYSNNIQNGMAPIGLSFISENPNEDMEEWYGERSKFFVACAIRKLVDEWRSHTSNDILRKASVRDVLERLSVFVGSLHSDDISDEGRRKLLDELNKLTQDVPYQ